MQREVAKNNEVVIGSSHNDDGGSVFGRRVRIQSVVACGLLCPREDQGTARCSLGVAQGLASVDGVNEKVRESVGLVSLETRSVAFLIGVIVSVSSFDEI